MQSRFVVKRLQLLSTVMLIFLPIDVNWVCATVLMPNAEKMKFMEAFECF